MSDAGQFLEKLDSEIDAEREVLFDLCASLVAAPSASPPGRTVEVAHIVEEFLNRGGITTERVALDPDAPNLVMSCLTPTWTQCSPVTKADGPFPPSS